MNETKFFGDVLDVGGKKSNRRGEFQPPIDMVGSWRYANLDLESEPDIFCNAENIPVKSGSFDMVVLGEIIEHLENPQRVLRECRRVLKKNGEIVATIPFLYPIHPDPYDYQRWTPSRINKEFSIAGFEVERIEHMGSIYSVLFDILRYGFVKSRNRATIRNRLFWRFCLPLVRKMCSYLDAGCIYKSEWITTGFYVSGKKLADK